MLVGGSGECSPPAQLELPCLPPVLLVQLQLGSTHSLSLVLALLVNAGVQ